MLGKSRFTAWCGIVLLAALSGSCTDTGEMRNPFEKSKPFVASAVPADFAIVVDEYHNTFYAQQHVQQVITAADMTSRTTYSNFNSYTNAFDPPYSQSTELKPEQMQAMWNAVQEHDLLHNSHVWVNFLTDSDWYKRNLYTLQIRANNQTRAYQQVNGFPGMVQPLMTLVNGVRLPLTQNMQVKVLGTPAATTPATVPSTSPSTAP